MFSYLNVFTMLSDNVKIFIIYVSFKTALRKTAIESTEQLYSRHTMLLP